MSDKIKCIFCGLDKKSSVEHVFPDSLGGQLIIKNVCKECNDFLGEKVDFHLVDHPLMQFIRAKYSLAGKKGHIPNPFSKAYLKDDPTRAVKVRLDGRAPYLFPSVKKSSTGDRLTISVDGSDRDKVPEIVNKALKRINRPEKTQPEIETIIPTVILDKPEIIVQLEADVNLFRKAILKIIYEFASLVLGDEYFHDPMAKKIREYIISPSLDVEGLYGDANIVNKKEPISPIIGELVIEEGYTAFIKQDGNTIFCYVNLFNQFEGTLVVTNNALRYKEFQEVFYSYNVVEKTTTKIN
ncbi:hypothetical protein NCCP2222_02030 [Sporosarcina sp. NCCP-2222]|uniref:HNH endonuclease n=1 Tax=Sporosarcina sp. NCCP-2222 TaxID=2935073 RepID=UPI002082A7FB|nr:HNH endonuclease [Sporosarcina sp. NCCP-2222]GKV54256.1 hypothetical protein NCCP2222_02030 [Sporosarcina sp. NCCP-2222]